MPTWAISLLAKIGPYAAAALIAFGGGVYVTHRWDLGELQTAKLALSNQQLADTKANNAWNVKATAFEAQIATLGNTVQAARQVQQQQAASTGATQEAALATQAAQPGQDGPVAPVLQAEHANLQQAPQGPGQ